MPGDGPARADRPDRLRHHRRGCALLPGGRAHGARQGRRWRWSRPTGTGSAYAQREVPLKVTEPQRVLVPRKAIQRDRAPAGGRGSGAVPAGGQPPGVHGRRPHARLQDDRGPVPGFREGDRRRRRQGGDPGARAPADGHPPGEPALLGAQPRRQAEPRQRASSSSRRRRPTWARRAESLAVEYKGGDGRDRLQRPVPPRFPRGGGHGGGAARPQGPESQGMFRPARADETDYRYVVMPMRL